MKIKAIFFTSSIKAEVTFKSLGFYVFLVRYVMMMSETMFKLHGHEPTCFFYGVHCKKNKINVK